MKILLIGIFLSAVAYGQPQESSDVNRLISDLRSSNPDVRWRAADSLVLRGGEAVDPLVEALKDSDPDTIRITADTLARIGKTAVEGLLRAVHDPNPSVRLGVVEALSRIDDPRSSEALIGAIRDRDPQVREKAVKSMLKIRDPRATELLIDAMNDSNQFVRENAIEALGRIRDARAVDPIMKNLTDRDPRVRKISADALWEMRSLNEVQAHLLLMKSTVEKINSLKGDAKKYVEMKEPGRYASISEDEYREIQIINENLRALSKIYPLIIRSGQVEAEKILAIIFNKYSDKHMVNDFLNCWNPRLMNIAYRWLQENMHSLKDDAGSVGPRWGQK